MFRGFTIYKNVRFTNFVSNALLLVKIFPIIARLWYLIFGGVVLVWYLYPQKSQMKAYVEHNKNFDHLTFQRTKEIKHQQNWRLRH